MASYFSMGSSISARSMRQPCGTKTPNLIATFHLPFLPVQNRVRANSLLSARSRRAFMGASPPKTQHYRLPVTWWSRKLVLPLMAPWALVRLDRTDADQLVRVGHQMDGLDNAVSHVEDDRRDRSPFQGGHDAWPPVHLRDAKVGVGQWLTRQGDQEPGHLIRPIRPIDRMQRRPCASPAVAYKRHPGGQNCQKIIQIPTYGSREETFGNPAARGLVGVETRATLANVLAGPAGQLPDRRLATAEDLGDLGIGHPESFPKHEYRSFQRR